MSAIIKEHAVIKPMRSSEEQTVYTFSLFAVMIAALLTAADACFFSAENAASVFNYFPDLSLLCAAKFIIPCIGICIPDVTGAISDKDAAALESVSEIDFCTFYRKPEPAEALEVKEELRRIFKEKGKEFERFLRNEKGESSFCQLHFIIKSVFELELSFNEFLEIANKAGYTVKAQTSYPPYYFLRYFLERKRWDSGKEIRVQTFIPPSYILRFIMGRRRWNYYAYRLSLIDKDNISVLLREKVLSLQCFNEVAVKDFFQKNADRYRMTFREAADDFQFQVDFIQYFFNAVYISGDFMP